MPTANPRPTTNPSLTLQRTYSAKPAAVYAAWTRPEALKAWFAPADDVAVIVAETDVRVGGSYRIVLQGADRGRHGVSGRYSEVVENRRLAFTWAWDSTPERETHVTVEFEPLAEGTRLTLTHERFFDEAARDRHAHGWTGSMQRLDRFFQSQS